LAQTVTTAPRRIRRLVPCRWAVNANWEVLAGCEHIEVKHPGPQTDRPIEMVKTFIPRNYAPAALQRKFKKDPGHVLFSWRKAQKSRVPFLSLTDFLSK
jgi:hypothetical protein